MSGLTVSKRIHIMPLGYEKDRVIDPAVQGDADEVILLEPGEENTEYHRPAYHSTVHDRITGAGINVRTENCNIFDLYDSLGTIAALANELIADDHNVHVNLASGSKVTAIGGMIACMATGATPYYVRAEDYAGGDENPVASGVKEIEMLPKYPLEEPDPQHIAVLEYISSQESVTKRELIKFGKEQGLPFVTRYDTADVKNPDRGYYRRLNSRIIEHLQGHDFIEVEKHSKYQYVSITENGDNQLEAFRYLLNSNG